MRKEDCVTVYLTDGKRYEVQYKYRTWYVWDPAIQMLEPVARNSGLGGELYRYSDLQDEILGMECGYDNLFTDTRLRDKYRDLCRQRDELRRELFYAPDNSTNRISSGT